MMCLFLLTVRVEHRYEDVVIRRGHIHQLEANIIDRRVVGITMTPTSSRRKTDKTFLRNLPDLVDGQFPADTDRNGHTAFELKSAGADV